MKITYLVAILFFAISMSACSSLKQRLADDSNPNAEIAETTEEQLKNEMEVIQHDYGKVELVVNKQVLKWMNYYKGRGRPHMRRYLERSTRYLDVMREVLREEGLPEDLVYLPIIESGFSSSAHSHASAVGYWQFIRGTGTRYGLQIDSYVDERRDPIDSTKAAAKFLKALYNLFGDWYLALASYNTGENRVKRVVMKYGTRDFWKLAQKKKLHRETRDYVPKFLAALIIAKNPRQYGFNDLEYKDGFAYDSIPVFRPISLELLARNIGHSYDDLKALNPKFRSDYVPIKEGATEYIRVPKGLAQQSVAVLGQSYSEAPKYIPKDYFYYRVRNGDTLSEIAHKNRTTVSTLRRLNGFGRRSFIRVGQRLRVPDRGIRTLERHRDRSTAAAPKNSGRQVYHTVRRGENLSVIARQYGTTVSAIKKLNSLGRRSMIRAGQKLVIRESSDTENSSSSRSIKPKYHVVKRGENLSLIANKYALSISDLKAWNELGSRALIYKGQKILLYSRTKKIVHVVKSGENLSEIADRYRVSVAAIARENELRNKSVIVAGRKLVIPR